MFLDFEIMSADFIIKVFFLYNFDVWSELKIVWIEWFIETNTIDKQLQKQIDAHKTKAASIHLRKQWLEKQKVANYQNEYERIRGMIAQSVVRHGPQTDERLEEREKKLKELGAIATNWFV